MSDKQAAKKTKEPEFIKEQTVSQPKDPKPIAKAGKRSAKSIQASETKLKKIQQKEKNIKEEVDQKPTKAKINPTRSRLSRISKNYRNKHKLIDKDKIYSINDASELIIKTNPTKFDATVELHIRLNVDPRQADQNIRDSLFLPAGSGKTIRVAAFVDNDNIDIAKKAGADIIGESSIVKELNANNFIFDIIIATPNMMPKLGKFARLLGPRGLMPNPKSGTVTNDIGTAIKDAKSGKIEYKVDSNGIIHIGVGKVSFTAKQVNDNIVAVVNNVKANRPASVKANYIISAYLTTTMGPSIKIEV